MKRIAILSLVFCLAALCACARKDKSSSAAASAPASSSVSSAVSSLNAAASGSSSASVSEAQSTSNISVSTEYSIPMTTSGGASVTLSLKVPSKWEYNGYTVFSDPETEIKQFEVVAVYEIQDSNDPITDEMLAPFGSVQDEAGNSSELIYGISSAYGRPIEYYRTSSVPDGANFTWYTFFTFSYDEQYVYQLHFFTTDETANISSFFDIIASAHAA